MDHEKKRRTVTHTVRTKNGNMVTIDGYSRSQAMALMCTECMGFENRPTECTSVYCPLFPWRRGSKLTRDIEKYTTTKQSINERGSDES